MCHRLHKYDGTNRKQTVRFQHQSTYRLERGIHIVVRDAQCSRCKSARIEVCTEAINERFLAHGTRLRVTQEYRDFEAGPGTHRRIMLTPRGTSGCHGLFYRLFLMTVGASGAVTASSIAGAELGLPRACWLHRPVRHHAELAEVRTRPAYPSLAILVEAWPRLCRSRPGRAGKRRAHVKWPRVGSVLGLDGKGRRTGTCIVLSRHRSFGWRQRWWCEHLHKACITDVAACQASHHGRGDQSAGVSEPEQMISGHDDNKIVLPIGACSPSPTEGIASRWWHWWRPKESATCRPRGQTGRGSRRARRRNPIGVR